MVYRSIWELDELSIVSEFLVVVVGKIEGGSVLSFQIAQVDKTTT